MSRKRRKALSTNWNYFKREFIWKTKYNAFFLPSYLSDETSAAVICYMDFSTGSFFVSTLHCKFDLELRSSFMLISERVRFLATALLRLVKKTSFCRILAFSLLSNLSSNSISFSEIRSYLQSVGVLTLRLLDVF